MIGATWIRAIRSCSGQKRDTWATKSIQARILERCPELTVSSISLEHAIFAVSEVESEEVLPPKFPVCAQPAPQEWVIGSFT